MKSRLGNFILMGFIFWSAQTFGAVLNSSVLLFSEFDLRRCPSQVQKAAQFGNKRISFTPSIHFIADQKWNLQSYCMLRSTLTCEPITPQVLETFQNYMKACFEATVANNMGITIIPHLDDAIPGGLWRNFLMFDPLVNYEGYSYYDVVLKPLLNALSQTVKPNSLILLSLQGEMGTTIFAKPDSYVLLIKKIRQDYPTLNLQLGVSVNWNGVDGDLHKRETISAPAVQRLIASLDFLGVSAYHPVAYPMTPDVFNTSILSTVNDFKKLGVMVPTNIPLVFSEAGLGGWGWYNGPFKAETPEQAAGAPFAGVTGAYSLETDPWQNPALRKFRYQYHENLLKFLAGPPTTWRVINAFLWNSASWDVQGIYTAENYYADPDIIELIKKYN
jgi:hypothetical protein